MADTTPIEWTDATWNPVTGCTIVDAGCTNCYAMALAGSRLRNHPSRAGLTRITGGRSKWTGEVRFNEQWLDQPLKWTRPRMIFVCAHGDLFHEAVPDEWIDRVFAVMALAPQHTFQVLTKRPERAREYLCDHGRAATVLPTELLARDSRAALRDHWPLPNVWLGTSASDQASADLRIPDLLACPAAVRFVSLEPLLGPVDLTALDSGREGHAREIDALTGYVGSGMYGDYGSRLDWVIVGGESGPGARPMHPDWPRQIRDQCMAAGVAFFFKQWGEWADQTDAAKTGSEDHIFTAKGITLGVGVRKFGLGAVEPDWQEKGGAWMSRVGKKAAGRHLDGRTWDQMPGDVK